VTNWANVTGSGTSYYSDGAVPELEAYIEWLRQCVLSYTGRGADHDPGEYMKPVPPEIVRRIQFGDERFWALVTALADAVQAERTLKWRRARQVLRDADPLLAAVEERAAAWLDRVAAKTAST
jgi:hypothetical protein